MIGQADGMTLRCAVLDDYQAVAMKKADWRSLDGRVTVETFHSPLQEDQIDTILAPFDIIVAMRERTRFDAARLAALPMLKLLITTGMENASIDLQAAADQGITVCGTRSLPHPTAEHTWALIMALCRHIPSDQASLRFGGWQTSLGIDLAGKTLGLVGFGRVGRVVARYARAFDMTPLAWSRSLDDATAKAHHAVRAASLHDLLNASDIVSVHIPQNTATIGMFNAELLSTMRPGALLINTSRGPIVDTGALADALNSGQIGGAAVDVFDVEPVAADNPLLFAPNTVLTPHMGYVTEENYELYYGHAVENILAWLAGQPVRELTAR